MHLLCVAQKLFSSPQDVYIPIFHHPPPLSRGSHFFPQPERTHLKGAEAPLGCVCVWGSACIKIFSSFYLLKDAFLRLLKEF